MAACVLPLTRIVMLFGGLATVCMLSAAPAQASHPRPKTATPIRMSLVPAYAACTTSNRTHGPPLAFGSCNPPVQTSAQATVGTPDALGGAADASGHLRLSYRPCLGGNCFPQDADMGIEAALNDVRCLPTGARCGAANVSGPADYSGELRISLSFRLSDHWNATAPGGGTNPGTTQDFAVGFDWVCGQSGSTATGSTCSFLASMNALIPGSAYGDRRSIWALDGLQIYDGGADGDSASTADNTVFMRPGVFVP